MSLIRNTALERVKLWDIHSNSKQASKCFSIAHPQQVSTRDACPGGTQTKVPPPPDDLLWKTLLAWYQIQTSLITAKSFNYFFFLVFSDTLAPIGCVCSWICYMLSCFLRGKVRTFLQNGVILIEGEVVVLMLTLEYGLVWGFGD